MPTYKIITLGCKVNQQESETISKLLKDGAWQPAPANRDADLYIINTCTVTGKASMQSRQEIRKAVKANPNAKIIVTGCYAQTSPDEIKDISGVHHVAGNAFKISLPEYILSSEIGMEDHTPSLQISNIMKEERFQTVPTILPGERTRPFLKIQDGCDTFCTYCIVPYARGKSRSMPKRDVMDHLRLFKKKGVHEAVLTGIHMGCYGKDLDPENGLLFDLLHTIDREKILDRIRLSSIEPHELTDDIIKLAASSDIICPHFHIPLQSGDDTVLHRMHRPYNTDLFENLVLKIKNHIPDAAIGVDVMAGFPGETEAAFDHTLRLVSDLPISYLHVFPFSPRKGTPAATYPGQINPDIIKKRCQRLREIGKAKRREFYKSAEGKETTILVETKRNPATGLLKGISPNYIPVLVNGDDHQMNRILHVTLNEVTDNLTVFGTL
jgi:threonylcarbamoyladenosine tRNA methylthiotransferase MtaB